MTRGAKNPKAEIRILNALTAIFKNRGRLAFRTMLCPTGTVQCGDYGGHIFSRLFCRLSLAAMANLLIRHGARTVHPPKEMKSPSGFGSVGVNGLNAKLVLLSKPALPAAVASANGVNAATAWSMSVHSNVRS